MPVSKWETKIILIPHKAQGSSQKRAVEILESRNTEHLEQETVFARHDGVFSQMDSKQLWLYAQYQDGEGIHKASPVAEKALPIDGCWREIINCVP